MISDFITKRIAALVSMFVKHSYQETNRSELERCRFTIDCDGEIIWQSNFANLEKYLKEHGAYFHEF